MPNIQSAAKRLRQNEKRRDHNRTASTAMKTAIKKVEQAVENNNPDAAKESLHAAVSVINKTARKGIIHKNKAARLTSRLTRKVNSMQAAETAE